MAHSNSSPDRRGLLKGAGLTAGLFAASATTVAGAVQASPEPISHAGAARPLTEKEKLARIASNTWPIRYIFKSRTGFGRNPAAQEMKKKYGEITMLDF